MSLKIMCEFSIIECRHSQRSARILRTGEETKDKDVKRDTATKLLGCSFLSLQ